MKKKNILFQTKKHKILLSFLLCIFISNQIAHNSVIFKDNSLNKFRNEPNVPLHQNISNLTYNSSSLSQYQLDVRVNETSAKITGNMTVNFYNKHNIEFYELPFHLYVFGMNYKSQPGSINITKIETLDLQNLTYVLLENDQLLWVELLDSVKPHHTTNFTIHFTTNLPDGGIDRANFYGTDIDQSRIIKFIAAYPMPCMYDPNIGWNIEKYFSVADPFYNDIAFYTLRVNIAKDMVIAATGNLSNIENHKNRTIYTYDPILPVREVTFSISRYFKVESKIFHGINVSTYYLPSSTFTWQSRTLKIVGDIISLYNTIGEYPYPTLNIVDEFSNYGGIACPLQVYVYAGYGANPFNVVELDRTISHGIAQQWFNGIVGNNEIEYGHLDEGLVVWMADWYFNISSSYNRFKQYALTSQVRKHHFYEEYPPEKINQSILEYNYPLNYWFNVYEKSPAIIEKFRKIIGHDKFIEGLQLLFNRFQFKFAQFNDLQKSFEEISGKSYDWFFKPWFENSHLPRYNITNPEWDRKANELRFTVTDLNEPFHEYIYHQKLNFSVYDNSNNILHTSNKWVNGTTTIILNGIRGSPIGIQLQTEGDYIMDLPRLDSEEINFVLFDPPSNKISLPLSRVIFFTVIGITIIINKNRRKFRFF